MLPPGLLRPRQDPQYLDAKRKSKLGVDIVMEILFLEVWEGASHCIDHHRRPSVLGMERQTSSYLCCVQLLHTNNHA